MGANYVFERRGEKAVVARFAKADVRDALYEAGHEHGDIGESVLYRELYAGAVAGLPDGGTLVLNFGPVLVLPSAFYRFLLLARRDVQGKGGRLVLCGMTKLANEAFTIMGGPRTFEVVATEEQALAGLEQEAPAPHGERQ